MAACMDVKQGEKCHSKVDSTHIAEHIGIHKWKCLNDNPYGWVKTLRSTLSPMQSWLLPMLDSLWTIEACDNSKQKSQLKPGHLLAKAKEDMCTFLIQVFRMADELAGRF